MPKPEVHQEETLRPHPISRFGEHIAGGLAAGEMFSLLPGFEAGIALAKGPDKDKPLEEIIPQIAELHKDKFDQPYPSFDAVILGVSMGFYMEKYCDEEGKTVALGQNGESV